MPIAMCEACQNVYMVVPELRQYCPVCGGDPLILQEEEAQPSQEQSQEEPTPEPEEPAPEPEETPKVPD